MLLPQAGPFAIEQATGAPLPDSEEGMPHASRSNEP